MASRWISGRPFRRAAGFVLGLCLAGGTAAAQPAMFRAEDADTRIYVLGTIHLVPCELPARARARVDPGRLGSPCAVWMTPAIEDALRAADEVWFESIDSGADPATQARIAELSLLRSGVLSDFVPAAEYREFVAMFASLLDLPDAFVEPQIARLQPWALMLTLTEMLFDRAGLSFEHGVDAEIMVIADRLGLPVRGFETAAQMIGHMAGDPLDVQVADLRTMVLLHRSGVDLTRLAGWIFDEMWEIWRVGDLDALAEFDAVVHDEAAALALYGEELAAALGLSIEALTALNDAAMALSPEDSATRYARDYAAFIGRRNEAWMIDLRRMLAGSGTYFVAVGAGHFVGEAALQDLLAAEAGVTVRRVQ